MTIVLSTLVAGLLGALFGIGIGYFARQFIASKRATNAESRAQQIINDGKSQAQDIVLEAKNTALKTLEESKKEEKERSAQLSRIESLLIRKETELEQKSKELGQEKEQLKNKAEEVVVIKSQIEETRLKQISELERIASLNRETAKAELITKIEEESKDELYRKIHKLDTDNQEEIEKKAREIVTLAVQRYAGSHISDSMTTVVGLPSDEVKGKIIGKEGRNIKTIERLTGVDVIIDDTPEALVISGFDPVRRQIARIAIEKLIADGRIHPAKIEEEVQKANEEINAKIKEEGEAALFETGVGPVDPKLTFLLGRLAFRTSFGQNILRHSVEMTHIAGMLASELGADVSLAKKGALFHDIGKALDHEVQGTHVEIGRKVLQKFNVDPRVIQAMEAHHDEYPYAILEARIVQAADAISGARPGARKDTVEVYLKRLEELERIATSFEGVEKSYAIQAGRELRIFVTPTRIDDLGAIKLAKDVARKIEEEMKYPGEIRVNVIRETRALEYAR
ncbi:MAG: ribonuclease Y [Candidatus Yanofskybacteria bacterium RIFCSPHIGHO2_01_FULL_41_21]|uniref:Ribonuclease Y n=2 Tax=Candidatus Yanofskyibacteriota TaxID=1752733 RepID=A0A1F8EBE1_9BACT|nr:MAG: ribonuclease Y [Candidatus Yanofskybacteria bacterium RIFCSPHIGHO2_01_FULL_41_21]